MYWTAFLLCNTYSPSWSRDVSKWSRHSKNTISSRSFSSASLSRSSLLSWEVSSAWREAPLIDHDQVKDRCMERFLLLQVAQTKISLYFIHFLWGPLGPRYLPVLLHRKLLITVVSNHSRIHHMWRGFVGFRYRQKSCTPSDHKLSFPMSWMCQIQSVVCQSSADAEEKQIGCRITNGRFSDATMMRKRPGSSSQMHIYEKYQDFTVFFWRE